MKTTNQYTIQLLQRLYFNLPPLVPGHIVDGLKKAMSEVTTDTETAVIEDLMIVFGKKIWAYNQAFEELCTRFDGELGEKLFQQKASFGLRRAFDHYKQTGGSWAGLYTGAVAVLFTSEERVELHQMLVDIRCDVREFARQAALITERRWYEERIAYYHELLGKIETELSHLRNLAEQEEGQSFLADEINEHVRSLELGLAESGAKVDYEAICNAHEHFKGRKKELRM